jgi:hypothetical protein
MAGSQTLKFTCAKKKKKRKKKKKKKTMQEQLNQTPKSEDFNKETGSSKNQTENQLVPLKRVELSNK